MLAHSWSSTVSLCISFVLGGQAHLLIFRGWSVLHGTCESDQVRFVRAGIVNLSALVAMVTTQAYANKRDFPTQKHKASCSLDPQTKLITSLLCVEG